MLKNGYNWNCALLDDDNTYAIDPKAVEQIVNCFEQELRERLNADNRIEQMKKQLEHQQKVYEEKLRLAESQVQFLKKANEENLEHYKKEKKMDEERLNAVAKLMTAVAASPTVHFEDNMDNGKEEVSGKNLVDEVKNLTKMVTALPLRAPPNYYNGNYYNGFYAAPSAYPMNMYPYGLSPKTEPNCFQLHPERKPQLKRSMDGSFMEYEDSFGEHDYCLLSPTQRPKVPKLDMASHNGDGMCACSKCNRGFSTSQELAAHNEHECRKPFMCKFCKKTFVAKQTLERHMKLHIPPVNGHNQ